MSGKHWRRLFDFSDIRESLARIEGYLVQLTHSENLDMGLLQDIQAKLVEQAADIGAITDVVDSAEALLDNQSAMLVAIKQQLADAIANGDPAGLQAVVDTLTATNEALVSQKSELADAVARNTPAADPLA